MENELMSLVAQFGSAGLIAVIWMVERRQAAARDRQLTEAHERVLQQRMELGQLLGVVSENTKAVTGLEHSQRGLVGLLERVLGAEYLTRGRVETVDAG
ncbi:MAG: hypothetical protein H6813_03475 [Phycisphaeraceae bacterium]|nr:hypothetical protein [Phycisphaeraceae bacterium]MCB9847007.1 hypothetical protein [Phycisphaeraceae bacterium]